MKFTLIKNVGAAATKVAFRTGLKLRKISPELMLTGGIIAGGAAIVTACIATKKAEPVVEETHEELNDIHDGVEDAKEQKKQSFKVYMRFVRKMVRIYGPSVLLFLLSVGLTLGSHGVLKKRYISTTIAYKALDEAFKDYRERVKEAVGEEKELHFFNGTEEGRETTLINEDGTSTTTKEIVKVHPKKNSPYEFDFNAHTTDNWQMNSDYNLMFLKGLQDYFTDLLISRGHVFMNEVLDALGIERTRPGVICGWLKGSGGDDYVDFGISEYYTDDYSDVQDGYLRNIHLNFNVDGVIWDKI